MSITAIVASKGGVGKSSIACNLAAISARQGARTLLVDLDTQGNASHYLLGHTVDDSLPGVGGLFEAALAFSFKPVPPTDFVCATPFPGLDVMPASLRLDDLETKLESRAKIYALRNALQQLATVYDHIYIDTAPAFNFYTRSALMAATRCLIPWDCDAFSRTAIYSLLAHVQEIAQDHNPGLSVAGIVVNQFQSGARLPQQLVDELLAEGQPVLQPYLMASVKMRESHQLSRPMVHLDPEHKLTRALLDLHRALYPQ